jgi:hypothetical protein
LEGKWRPELLFVLQEEVEMYDVYQRRTFEYDEQLQKHLAVLQILSPFRHQKWNPRERE